MNFLANKKILLAITGGIAAYKAVILCRLLKKANAHVQVVMSKAATEFVTPLTFQAISGNPVLTNIFDDSASNDAMAHIHLVRDCDLFVIAPATADCLAKIAHGFAEDLISALVLARNPQKCPLLLAPAMNNQMWENQITQENIAKLATQNGVKILYPAAGSQACGEIGVGRLVEPEFILEEIAMTLAPKILANQKVVITAGSTFERIDSVRGITNLSSGKMGFAIAKAAKFLGGDVCLIHGGTQLENQQFTFALFDYLQIQRIKIQTAEQMYNEVMQNFHENSQKIFVSVAAVADYRPSKVVDFKLKKNNFKHSQNLNAISLIENPDILASVAALPENQRPFCVGFAAESENMHEYAKQKLTKKNIPLLVGNLIQDGFGGENNKIILFDKYNNIKELPPDSKDNLAIEILKYAKNMLENK